jgi:Poly (ADP-ribose) glycohydrolase (PARG)
VSEFLIHRQSFVAQELMAAYPPKFKHASKKLVTAQICPEGAVHQGSLEFTRWRALALPESLPTESPTKLETRPDFFTYDDESAAAMSWHLNFAHQDLFCAYGGALLAQDELQVLEHPALGALREALITQKITLLTVEGGKPTPVLIRGVERRAALDMQHLYGNQFARAKLEAILSALTLLTPPTRSNILAMEAPSGGYGSYTLHELEFILMTAYTGFSAACHETGAESVIHTGFWGCGAYGGNRIVMTLLQLLAARLAGVGRLVFHTGDAASLATIAAAQALLLRLETPSPVELLAALRQEDLRWGVSDGN